MDMMKKFEAVLPKNHVAELIFTTPSSTELCYPLILCVFEVGQLIDRNGKPFKKIAGGMLHITFKQKVDNAIVYWAMNPHAKKDCQVVVYDHFNDMQVQRRIKLKDAFCVNLKEVISEGNKRSLITDQAIISCKAIEVDDIGHENDWDDKTSSDN